MSDRLTPDWVENSEQAFGQTGAIGDRGEAIVFKLLCEIFGAENVRLNQSDEVKQKQGRDIEVLRNGTWVGIDVKTNFHPEYRNVLVDVDKIWRTDATVWFHQNLEDPSSYTFYYVARMQEYIDKNDIPPQGSCYRIPLSDIKALQNP